MRNYRDSSRATPWGKADSAYDMGDGITKYNTPGHGGAYLPEKLNAMIPGPFRSDDGWYEEDCEIHAVVYFLWDRIHPEVKPDGYTREKALGAVKRWFAAEWAAVSGEDMFEAWKDHWSERSDRSQYEAHVEKLKKRLADGPPKPFGKPAPGKVATFPPKTFRQGDRYEIVSAHGKTSWIVKAENGLQYRMSTARMRKCKAVIC